jgi:Xaa-Pro dipeptidase
MSYSVYTTRQEKLSTALDQYGLNALALNPGPSLTYLTGLHFHLSERPVVAFFIPGLPVHIVLPVLERLKVENLPFPIQAFPYPEDPSGWDQVFRQAAESSKLQGMVGIEPRQFRVLELRLVETAAPGVTFTSAENLVADLRMQKDQAELGSMRQAVHIAQEALGNTLPHFRVGMSEKELASELILQTLRAGSDGELPFMPIVSAGPNSANPHATPTNRPIQLGDLLVIDWGAAYAGYFSDLTRTYAIGEVETEYQQIAKIVLLANTAGRAAGKPGEPAKIVDLAARGVIEAAGYGDYFTHRTGHGLGMEGHEPPYMRNDNDQILLPGMTYTVEPGIYLPDRNGVRIEDDMVITQEGAESLSDLPRELATLPL